MTCRGRGDALCSVDEMEVFELLGDDESLRDPIAAPYEFMATVWMLRKVVEVVVVVVVKITPSLCFVAVVQEGLCTCSVICTCNAVRATSEAEYSQK